MTKKDLETLLEYGESDWLDWKADFPSELAYGRKDAGWESGRATLLKDLVSLANCRGRTPAYLVYGVKDLRIRREVTGIKKSFDDADFQQWARAVFDPQPEFHYSVYSGETGHLFRFKPATDRSEATLDGHYTSLWPE